MKYQLRVALPPVVELTAHSPLPFVLLDRHLAVQRCGELPLESIAAALPYSRIHAILHPDDAVVVSVDMPPLPASRMDAAVQARIEPMTLNAPQELCIAYGRRNQDGKLPVAWTSRRRLEAAWRLLHESGLTVAALVPTALAVPPADPHPDRPLRLPADARWTAPLPTWSLARPQWQPARRTRRWAGALMCWGGAAAIWLLGLNIYAYQLEREAENLQADMHRAVREAFPSVTVVLDPLVQAQREVARLYPDRDTGAANAFLPFALQVAKLLPFASGHVRSLEYRSDELILKLAEGYTPPADENALRMSASAQALEIVKDPDATHTWRIRRADAKGPQGARR